MRSATCVLAAGLFAAALSGCGGESAAPASPSPATMMVSEPEPDVRPVPPVKPGGAALVRFVMIPGCVMCQKIDGALTDLQGRHGAALKAERYESTNPHARRFLRELNMDTHGLVIFDRSGQVCWKNDGHNLEAAALEKAVDAALSKK